RVVRGRVRPLQHGVGRRTARRTRDRRIPLRSDGFQQAGARLGARVAPRHMAAGESRIGPLARPHFEGARMTMHRCFATAVTVSLVALSTHSLRADVRADEKTRFELGGALGRFVNMFAGKAAKEGVTTSIAVKGNRAARMNEDTGQIIDLTEEKVYDLD